MRGASWGALTIRFRLGAALAIALAPVLLLGVAQAMISFRNDAADREAGLLAAADRSAAVARSRVDNAVVLLETLRPETVGLQCAPRLREVLGRAPEYANLIRFDLVARVSCAADGVRPDPARELWFDRLRRGTPITVTNAPAGLYARDPAVIAAVRSTDDNGRFDGALAAVIRLSSLKPDLGDRDLPRGTEVALIDGDGHFLIGSAIGKFARPPPGLEAGAVFYKGRDAAGDARMFAAAPLAGGGVRLLMSAPNPGLFSWALLNPLSTLLLPVLAFSVALVAVWVVADQVVVRWLRYLQRIAAIYARGRFTVRPFRTGRAPPEIRELGDTLNVMAEAIIGRDQSLRESLDQKDALMREIHHRVKNNLQVISSLLNMQQRAMLDPAARAAMSDTRQRVNAMALIYRALYQGPDLKRVDLKPFLQELAAQVLSIEGAAGAVRTELEADELVVDPDKLAPLALFAVEAISNAQKHALAHRAGLLRVRFVVDGAQALLEVSDEGAGSPLVAPISEGVGRTLMNAFARQLRGRAEVLPNAAGGVTARLVFPTPGTQASKPSSSKGRRNQAAA